MSLGTILVIDLILILVGGRSRAWGYGPSGLLGSVVLISIVLFLLGASIAATALLEFFVLGILGWLYALLIAVAAIGVALLLGAYLSRSGPPDARGVSPQA